TGTWTGVAAAAAVVAIAVGATVTLGGGGLREVTPASGPEVTPTGAATPEVTPQGDRTDEPWPTGADGSPQQDRTAAGGQRFEQGAALLDEVIAALPAGYTVPATTPEPPASGAYEDYNPATDPWARLHQSQFVDRVNGVEVWEHLASLAVSRGGGTGRLLVQVMTPGNPQPADVCGIGLWTGDIAGCTRLRVGDREVAVMTPAVRSEVPSEFDSWAAYRHADGTIVVVGQARTYRGAEDTPLPAPVFTDQQLAELAADERFHIT
ncbi:MAG TPA: hypothetical protein VGD67_05590, partial [Pseudonocardiaceae bacterium]